MKERWVWFGRRATKAFRADGSGNKFKFWLSVRRVENCLFSRRNGYMGVRVFGLSICLRLFGVDLLTEKKGKKR